MLVSYPSWNFWEYFILYKILNLMCLIYKQTVQNRQNHLPFPVTFKVKYLGWQDGSEGGGICCQADNSSSVAIPGDRRGLTLQIVP